MSLLGRLEDLSLTDIIQIVFLSRRTGILEIIDEKGRHTVLFRHGLVVNAASPDQPDLVTFLEANKLIPASAAPALRRMEENGIPHGTAAVEMNLLSATDLGAAIRRRILDVVTPLLQSREGEFNFILSESMTGLDIEYEPDSIFKDGGLAPAKIFGATDGEKIKPLQGLEQSLKAGKALLRGTAAPEATPAALNLGLGAPLSPPRTDTGDDTLRQPPPPPPPPVPDAASAPQPESSANVLPFPGREERAALKLEGDFTPIEESTTDLMPVTQPGRPSGTSPGVGQFKVAGGLFEIESPEAVFRNVVLYERNPLVRVAAKRAFTRRGTKIAQYGSLDDVRTAIGELFRSNSFFVTFLELAETDRGVDAAVVRLMQQIKRKNPRLPVVIVDTEADLRRRHDLLRAGADLYLTKPTPAKLQPGLAEEELALFADEMVLFCERAFQQWEQVTGGFGAEAGKRFYELAGKESVDRSFSILKQLINELSNPNDISQVSATILRLSAEYLERGALFIAGPSQFIGLGGFGTSGVTGEDIDARVRDLRLARGAPSVLAEVAESGEAHRGKMRRTQTNVELIERLGGVLPTEVAVLPIMHLNRTIGILYGDNAENHGPIDNMTGLEIFLSQAGYAFGKAVYASEQAGRPG